MISIVYYYLKSVDTYYKSYLIRYYSYKNHNCLFCLFHTMYLECKGRPHQLEWISKLVPKIIGAI